ncbi:MAG: glycosyltransferase family 2 protein [Acidobacteriia bacterium]|nr:glycosyltransferase family 2 protein [Terriglobia bacterium]
MFGYLRAADIFILHIFWIVLFGLIASLWVVQGVRAGFGMSRLPWLRDAHPSGSPDAPLLSIIFAARDESEKLPAALATQLDQDYPRYEVIAVNDRSQDQTPGILRDFQRTNPNLKVIDLDTLPAGWLGKPHALVAGFEQSRGEWIVFTDADVHFAPDVLRRAVALAEERHWDHLSLLASVEMRGFWEITAISYFGLGFVFGNEPWLTSNPRSGRYVGIGAFQLVRRAAYEKSGGHARLRMDVIEDMKLGKIVKRAGFRSGVAVAQDMVKVRWHSGVHNVIRGVTKNMFAACHYNAIYALGAMLLTLVMSVLPFFGVAFGLGWARVFAGIAVAAAVLIHGGMVRSTDASPLYGLTHPLGALLFCWMMARSAIATLWRGGVVWRETFYPLEELRKGLV